MSSGDLQGARNERIREEQFRGYSEEEVQEGRLVRGDDGRYYREMTGKRGRGGALNAAVQGAAAVGATLIATVAAAPVAAGVAAAHLVGEGPAARSWAAGKVKKLKQGVADIASSADRGNLASTAAEVAKTVFTGGLYLTSKTGREAVMADHKAVLRETTFGEVQQARKAETQEANQCGYNARSAKSIADFLNAEIESDRGQVYEVNGKLLYLDKANGRFLFAKKSADGRAVAHTACCMEVREKSFSKLEKVSTEELDRTARMFALSYDELMNKSADLRNLTGKALEKACGTYLKDLSKTKDASRALMYLTQYIAGKHTEWSDQQKATRFGIIQNYVRELARMPAENWQIDDRDLEKQLGEAVVAQNFAGLDQAKVDDYCQRYGLDITHANLATKTEELKTHLDKRKLFNAQLQDHVQKRILETMDIAYTSLGQENDTQYNAVMDAFLEKEVSMLQTLFPNGTRDLSALQELAGGERNSLTVKSYLKREGITDNDAIEAHLKKMQTRFGVNNNAELATKLGKEITQVKELLVEQGKRTIATQQLLLRAINGAQLSRQEAQTLTNYLKREGVVSKDYQGEIEDFNTDPGINKERMGLFIDKLRNRYGVGNRQQFQLRMQREFVKRQQSNDWNIPANQGAFINYLKAKGVVAADHRGPVTAINAEKASHLADLICVELNTTGIGPAAEVLDLLITENREEQSERQQYELMALQCLANPQHWSQAERSPGFVAYLKRVGLLPEDHQGAIQQANIQNSADFENRLKTSYQQPAATREALTALIQDRRENLALHSSAEMESLQKAIDRRTEAGLGAQQEAARGDNATHVLRLQREAQQGFDRMAILHLIQERGAMQTLGSLISQQEVNISLDNPERRLLHDYLKDQGVIDRIAGNSIQDVDLDPDKLRELKQTLLEKYGIEATANEQQDLNTLIGKIDQQVQNERAKLQDTSFALIEAAGSAKLEAKEKAHEVRLISDAWSLVTGNKAHGDFSANRIREINTFLRSRGAKMAENGTIEKINWQRPAADEAEEKRRTTIKRTLNVALEQELRVINTGREGAIDHVSEKLKETLDRLDMISKDETGDTAIQERLYQESWSSARPKYVQMRKGVARVTFAGDVEIDPVKGTFKRDPWEKGVKIKLSESKKEHEELFKKKEMEKKEYVRKRSAG